MAADHADIMARINRLDHREFETGQFSSEAPGTGEGDEPRKRLVSATSQPGVVGIPTVLVSNSSGDDDGWGVRRT